MVQYEIILVSAVFLGIGSVITFKPDSYLKFARWQMKTIWKADLRFTKSTTARARLLGTLFLIIGLAVLYSHLILGKA